VADAQIVADCELTLSEAHAVAERARYAMLHAVPKLADVRVHVDPCDHEGVDHHADLAHHDAARPVAPPFMSYVADRVRRANRPRCS